MVLTKNFWHAASIRRKIWFVPFFTLILLTVSLGVPAGLGANPPVTEVKDKEVTAVTQNVEPPPQPAAQVQDSVAAVQVSPQPAGGQAAVEAVKVTVQPQVKPSRGGNASPSSAPNSFAALYDSASKYLGVPYVFGGNDPKKGLDCSSFVQLAFRGIGIQLPRSTYSQINVGTPVSYDQLRPGDLVFFSSSGPGPSHVGIYIGNGQMINETRPQVQISRIDGAKRRATFYGARRILP